MTIFISYFSTILTICLMFVMAKYLGFGKDAFMMNLLLYIIFRLDLMTFQKNKETTEVSK